MLLAFTPCFAMLPAGTLMARAQDDMSLDSSAIGFTEPGNGVAPPSYSVVGFAALENEVVAQTVPIGTPQETLILPDELQATVDEIETGFLA